METGGGELPERRSKQQYSFTTLLQLFSVTQRYIEHLTISASPDIKNLRILTCIKVVSSQLADGPTRRRIKSSRHVGELVLNPIQLIRS